MCVSSEDLLIRWVGCQGESDQMTWVKQGKKEREGEGERSKERQVPVFDYSGT